MPTACLQERERISIIFLLSRSLQNNKVIFSFSKLRKFGNVVENTLGRTMQCQTKLIEILSLMT
jgi:hypothetical protein